jgi:hypothetical protein
MTVAEGVAVAGIRGVLPKMGVLPNTGVAMDDWVAVGAGPGLGRLQPVSRSAVRKTPSQALFFRMCIVSSCE